MLSEDINALVQLARQGNAPALAELVGVVQRDLRVFIAAFAASHEMAEAVFTEVWQLGQRDIVETQDMTGWLAAGDAAAEPVTGLIDRLRAYARDRLRERLATSARQAVEAQDTLLHVVTRSASEALEAAGTTAPMIAAPVAERMKRMPPAATGLLEKRYRGRLSLAAIATAQGRSPDEVAEALCTARSTVDWQFDGQLRIDPGDRRFPVEVEEYIAGTIAFDVRTRFGESLMADLGRASAFERQIRIDLVLTALLRQESRQDVAEAVAEILPELASGPAPAPTINRQSSPLRTQSDQLRPARGVKSKAPLGIAVGVLAAVVIIVALVLANRTPPPSLPPPAPPTVLAQPSVASSRDPSATTVAEADGIGQVRRCEGVAYLRVDGKLLSAQPGAVLSPGQGIETSGAGSRLDLVLGDRGEVDLGGDTAVLLGNAGAAGSSLTLAHGSLRVDGAVNGRPLQVACDNAILDATAAAFSVSLANGELAVTVERGTVALSRGGESTTLTIDSGNRATIDAGGRLTVDSGGRWVRGIALGDRAVSIAGVRWLPLRHALADGLRLGAGSGPAGGGGRDPALDSETSAMLASGIASPQGQLRLSQPLPNGRYDIDLWLGGTTTDARPRISLGGREALVASGGTGSWRRLGPLRTTVSARSLDIEATLPAGAYLAGLAIRAVGPGDEPLPPTVFLTAPVDDLSVTASDPLLLKAEAYASDGSIRAVEFYADAIKIGEALAAPYSFSWDHRTAGTSQISVRAISTAGAIARSAGVAVQVKLAEKSKPGLILALVDGGISTAPATITLTATMANVVGGIERIEFLAGGVKLGEAVAAPYQFTWSKVAAGDYTLTASLKLATGETITSPALALTIAAPANFPPTVAIESPLDGDEIPDSGRLTIRAKAADADGRVARVEFLVDEQRQGEATAAPFSFTWTKATAGVHRISAIATDDRGASTAADPVLVLIGKGAGFVLARGINLGGEAVDIDGCRWLSHEEAVRAGLQIRGGAIAADSVQPVPAAEGGLAAMLSTSLQGEQDELGLSQPLPDGIYQVCLWMCEPKAANAHLCEVEVEGIKQPQPLGRLGRNAWAKYGPFLAKVHNQSLGIVVRAARGASPPKLMGLTISVPGPGSFPRPLVEFLFDAFKGNITPNTGLSAAIAPVGVLSAAGPQRSSIVPPNGGSGSVDFGRDFKPAAVDVAGISPALRGLKSFTISAWLNNRVRQENGGGDRIINWQRDGADGVELVYHDDGSLQIAINGQVSDKGAPRSSGDRISSNDAVPADNWRFFAVTYDSTAASQQVRYYFGSGTEKATLDRAVDYNRGAVGANPANELTIGHTFLSFRQPGADRMYRGIIDQVRIWGSPADASAVLTPEQIVAVQNAANPAALRLPLAKADAVISKGLLVWLTAYEGATTVGGVLTQWLDQSGNGHHASAKDRDHRPRSVVKEVNGKPALYFHGEDALVLADSTGIEPETLTLMAWVRLDKIAMDGETRRWIIGKTGNELDNGHFSLFTDKGAVGGYLNIGGGGNHNETRSPAGLMKPLTWHHLAMTYDGAKLLLYLDGARVGERQVGKPRTTGTGAVVLGRRPDMWGNFIGQMDEVRAYDRALMENEIQAIERQLREKFFSH